MFLFSAGTPPLVRHRFQRTQMCSVALKGRCENLSHNQAWLHPKSKLESTDRCQMRANGNAMNSIQILSRISGTSFRHTRRMQSNLCTFYCYRQRNQFSEVNQLLGYSNIRVLFVISLLKIYTYIMFKNDAQFKRGNI